MSAAKLMKLFFLRKEEAAGAGAAPPHPGRLCIHRLGAQQPAAGAPSLLSKWVLEEVCLFPGQPWGLRPHGILSSVEKALILFLRQQTFSSSSLANLHMS